MDWSKALDRVQCIQEREKRNISVNTCHGLPLFKGTRKLHFRCHEFWCDVWGEGREKIPTHASM